MQEPLEEVADEDEKNIAPAKPGTQSFIDGWRVAYRQLFPERTKTTNIRKRLKKTYKTISSHDILNKLQTTTRHRPVQKQYGKVQASKAKTRAAVFKQVRKAAKGL